MKYKYLSKYNICGKIFFCVSKGVAVGEMVAIQTSRDDDLNVLCEDLLRALNDYWGHKNRVVIIEAGAFAVRRVVACKETLQGGRGVMADLLVATLIVRYGPEASPHILWVVAVEVLLNVRTCILPASWIPACAIGQPVTLPVGSILGFKQGPHCTVHPQLLVRENPDGLCG